MSGPAGSAGRVFLTAEWRQLVLLNYAVDPALLAPLVPDGTELEAWNGETYLSLVGFRFLATRVLGVPIPGHRDFEEVNLRFYVQRRVEGEWRRGVVFVREVVPRFAIAAVARWCYGERYVSAPMSHRTPEGGRLEPGDELEYAWRYRGQAARMTATLGGPPALPDPDSEPWLMVEHYWGYARRPRGTVEYRVEHPPWRVAPTDRAELAGDLDRLYGRELATVLRDDPTSSFAAEGSPVSVFAGSRVGDVETATPDPAPPYSSLS